MDKITIRSDRDTDYTFMYRGEETVLKAGSIISIANGLNDVVLPTVDNENYEQSYCYKTGCKIALRAVLLKDDKNRPIWLSMQGRDYE